MTIRTGEYEVGGSADKRTSPAYFCLVVTVLFYDSPEHVGDPKHVTHTALAHFKPLSGTKASLSYFYQEKGIPFFSDLHRSLFPERDLSTMTHEKIDNAAICIAGACTGKKSEKFPDNGFVETDVLPLLNAVKTLCKKFGLTIHAEHIGGLYGPKTIEINDGKVLCTHRNFDPDSPIETERFVLSDMTGNPQLIRADEEGRGALSWQSRIALEEAAASLGYGLPQQK